MPDNMRCVEVEYVDYSEQPEGQVVAKSDVRGWGSVRRNREIEEMKEIHGHHIVAREVWAYEGGA
jgi:hypothetical protein